MAKTPSARVRQEVRIALTAAIATDNTKAQMGICSGDVLTIKTEILVVRL